jgi:hypothetical protein
MTITEEAVQAAAQAIHRHDVEVGLSTNYAPNKHHLNEARAALEAAETLIIAQAAKEARTNNDHITPGEGAYSSGFHYALDCVHSEETE